MIQLLMLSLFVTAADDSLIGHWAGGFEEPSEYNMVEIEFLPGESSLVATIHLIEKSVRLEASVEQDADHVTWTVRSDTGTVRAHFEGRLAGDELRGQLEGPHLKKPAPFDLLRVAKVTSRQRTDLVGAYSSSDGSAFRVISVQLGSSKGIALDSPQHGIRSVLYALSPNEFAAGTGESPLPIRARLRIERDRDGSLASATLEVGDDVLTARRKQDSDEEPLAGPSLDVPQVERRSVTIDAGDIQLAATLYFPPGAKRPCPAVVQMHGSAPTVRTQQWHFFTSICLRSGLAVLAFDKRGCGDSTGRFRNFTVAGSEALFDQLASDGAAAFEWLRLQDGIDADRVGLVGGSQAGWIMPLVAEKAPGVRFIISACGPTVSAGEEHQHAALLSKGLSVRDADLQLESWDGARGYDPRPLLRRTDTPILWMFGEKDDVIPTRACLSELSKLRDEGHENHIGHVFSDANHNFQTSTGDGVLLEPVIKTWLLEIGAL